jgi:smad nuclear-interacting protein 1
LDFKPRSKSPLQEGEDEMLEEKDEPNFNPSGKLAAETKTFNGVLLKYHEPPEARKPTNKNWRLYVFKGKEQLDLFHIHRQSAYLFGRDRVVVDIPLDHPSSSKQHAVIQFRQVCSTNEFGDSKTTIKFSPLTTLKIILISICSDLTCANSCSRWNHVHRPFIIDLESANGTFVNGDKIPASRYYELQSGDGKLHTSFP